MSGNATDSIDLAVEANECELLAAETYDIIKTIIDPERTENLEELGVVSESGTTVSPFGDDEYLIQIEFVPTVKHCTLATLIGLCIRTKIERSLTQKHKLDIHIRKGSHSTTDEINKQINDKERIAAAMENPSLREMVEKCIDMKD